MRGGISAFRQFVMSDKDIEKMLKDIVKQVDYDIYKNIYVSPEEPEIAEEQKQTLVKIVKNHMGD